MPDETDDTDDIGLPRYPRAIGVARGPVAGPLATGPGGSIGVLTPFAGLLNGPVGLDEGAFPTFAYLTRQALVVERTREREYETVVGTDRRKREEPGQAETLPDRAETAGKRRVYHLLREGSVRESLRNEPVGEAAGSDPSRTTVGRVGPAPEPEMRSSTTRWLRVAPRPNRELSESGTRDRSRTTRT